MDDRWIALTGVSNTRNINQHKVIRTRGQDQGRRQAVNYIISGLHLILIYAPGTSLDDLNRTLIEARLRPFPAFSRTRPNRIYRGVDPRGTTPLDRV